MIRIVYSRRIPDPHDDSTLITAAQGGDKRALDQLLRLHQPMIHSICRRITGNDADALDATQESLISIVKGLDRFDNRARFSTWAYRVTTNACLDELRRRGRRPLPGLDDQVEATNLAASTEPRDPAATVSAQIDVDRALSRLPDDFRVAVVLRDLVGLDYAEIAEVLDIAPGTVRSRIARGRSRLADIISGNQNPNSDRQSSQP